MRNLVQVSIAVHGPKGQCKLLQPLFLGILRTDYLPDKHTGSLKMVEMNTVAAAGGIFSDRVGALHRFIARRYLESGEELVSNLAI